jgi:hypothetical protein
MIFQKSFKDKNKFELSPSEFLKEIVEYCLGESETEVINSGGKICVVGNWK